MRVPNRIAERGVTPSDSPGNGLGVRIQEELGGVEPMAGLGLVGAMHPVAVELPWTHSWQVDVPDLGSVFRHADPRHFPVPARPIKQTELYLGGVLRKEGKIDPCPVPRRTHRIRPSRPYLHDALLNG